MTSAWLHMDGLFGGLATPVRVLSRGPKRSRVRLVHRLRWSRKWFEAGSTRYVPTESLALRPGPSCMIGVGRGVFVPPDSPRAAEAVRRHSEKMTDRALRSQVSSKRAGGELGRKS